MLSTRPDSWPVVDPFGWRNSTRWPLLTINLERPSNLFF
nr:MAG TPA: hypothetical protein [Caudoviricetes sp.]DAU96851.1 MAG TPA: hypothetical protein [Caudoviricetes sp.]